MARTTSRSTSGPDPAAWERSRLRCSSVRSSTGMCRVADRAESGRDAVVSDPLTCEGVDHVPGRHDRSSGLVRHDDKRVVAGHCDYLFGGDRADSDHDGVHTLHGSGRCRCQGLRTPSLGEVSPKRSVSRFVS